MGKIGKIAPIRREYTNSGLQTMEGGLAQIGRGRVPGTGVYKFPFKELDGKYRTGLDPDAAYIKRIKDPVERDLEIKRVKETKQRIQDSLGDIDLGPRAPFWDYSKSLSTDDTSHIQPYKLIDDVNMFDLSIAFRELTFSWLRVHPTIASSFQAWERGDYPADTQFYVMDDDVESAILFKKKQSINKAIAKFDAMTPDKKKRVARLLGLPVTDNSPEDYVYNAVDNVLKDLEFKTGKFQGFSTVEMFNKIADMKEDLLHVKDLVKQSISHSIYRMKANGKMYEGELEIAKDEDDLVKMLMDDDNQDMLFALDAKLKAKKIATL